MTRFSRNCSRTETGSANDCTGAGIVAPENRFEYKSALEAPRLWTAVGESIDRVLAVLGIDIGDSAAETGDKLKEGAKSVIDRLRKREEQ